MEKLKNEILQDAKKDLRLIKKRLNDKEHQDRMFREYLTELSHTKLQNKEITKAEAKKKALQKAEKNIQKEIDKKMAKLEKIEQAPELESIDIVVTWSKNSTWGWNPHATAKIYTDQGYEQTTGSASGCGYDKQSAAIAQALNQSMAALKPMAVFKNKQLKKGKKDTNESGCTYHDNRDIIAYGAGYSVIPYFEGGVGVSCFRNIWEKLGYTWTETWTEDVQVYHITKEAR